MESNSNDDVRNVAPTEARPGEADERASGSDPLAAAPAPATPIVSAAVIKFRSCRWRRPPEEGVECCGHRDVLPIAGTTSFDPEAWCPDCTFFKLRRTPKKPQPRY
ncbi:MAG TPA: hypothetical protein VNK41_06770 [Vicinamibacterales bacterium]|nr:hypothetical protein [Vicinamibacterales bacterium]